MIEYISLEKENDRKYLEYLKLRVQKRICLEEIHCLEIKIYDVEYFAKHGEEGAKQNLNKYIERTRVLENKIKEIDKKIKNESFEKIDFINIIDSQRLNEYLVSKIIKLEEENERLKNNTTDDDTRRGDIRI